jgi:hypothetical protein
VDPRVTERYSQKSRKYIKDIFIMACKQREDEEHIHCTFFEISDGHWGRETTKFAKEHLMEYDYIMELDYDFSIILWTSLLTKNEDSGVSLFWDWCTLYPRPRICSNVDMQNCIISCSNKKMIGYCWHSSKDHHVVRDRIQSSKRWVLKYIGKDRTMDNVQSIFVPMYRRHTLLDFIYQ